MNNREKLIDMMHDHKLERRDLAELVLVDRQTVAGWLAPTESANHQEVPEMAIELLQLKLGVTAVPARGEEPTAEE
ncbi:MAG: hypothetical protein ACU85U_18220 [Gammaproteobacteria bacterium]|jgi:hypothetical protein